jgi:hypothetical protein
LSNVVSTAACEEVCKREPSCDIFSYDKRNGICRRYTRSVLLDFKSNEQFDSGVRQTNPSLDIKVAAPTSPAATQVSSTGLFTIRTNTEAMGLSTGKSNATSRAACEEICTREASCRIFTYRKATVVGATDMRGLILDQMQATTPVYALSNQSSVQRSNSPSLATQVMGGKPVGRLTAACGCVRRAPFITSCTALRAARQTSASP